jgi:hypothetical protein
MPAGLNTNQASTRQTTANGILSSIVADLRATPVTSTKSTQFGITFQQRKTLYFAGDGTYSTTPGANTIFGALVTFSNSGGGDNDVAAGASTGTVFADVKVFWPYSAGAGTGGADNDSNVGGDSDVEGGGSGGSGNSTTPAGNVESFVGLDRITAGGVSGGSGD